jgi:hypothetical protein
MALIVAGLLELLRFNDNLQVLELKTLRAVNRFFEWQI